MNMKKDRGFDWFTEMVFYMSAISIGFSIGAALICVFAICKLT